MAEFLLVADPIDDRIVAQKTYRGPFLPGGRKERRILANGGLSCTPKLIRSEQNEGELILFEEYIEGRKIGRERLGRSEAQKLARQVVESLVEIHEAGEMVGDLKIEDIVFRKGKAYIVDFSAQVVIEGGQATFQVSNSNLAPEIRQGKIGDFGQPTDIWDFGNILKDLHPSLKGISKKCQREDVDARPSAKEILSMLENLEKRPRRIAFACAVLTILPMIFLIGGAMLTEPSDLDPIREILGNNPSQERLWEARRKASLLPDEKKVEAARIISKFTGEPFQVNNREIQAVFGFDVPGVLISGKLIGTGSNVALPDGTNGFLVSLRMEEAEEAVLMTKSGLRNWDFSLPDMVGFDALSPVRNFFEPGIKEFFDEVLHSVVILPNGSNLGLVLSSISTMYGIGSYEDLEAIQGIIAGTFPGVSPERFFKDVGPPLGLEYKDKMIEIRNVDFRAAVPIGGVGWSHNLSEIGDRLHIEVTMNRTLNLPRTFSFNTDLKQVFRYFEIEPKIENGALILTLAGNEVDPKH